MKTEHAALPPHRWSGGWLLLGVLLWRGVGALPEIPAEVTRGSLLLQGPGGSTLAPALSTEVRMEVHAMIARVSVSQRFRNPSADWVEALYVFPLPDDAAVDRLRLQVGERTIEGRVRERAAAERDYAEARDQGRGAALVTQERPNVFTTAAANVAPGAEVLVQIGYQQTVQYRDGDLRLRFPLVVGPRYVPGTPLPPARERLVLSGGWALDTDRVPDASRITPPVADPGQQVANPVDLRVRLDAGMDLAWVRSSYHPMREARDGALRELVLAEGPIPADRDFELVWRPAPGSEPRAALFTEDAPPAADPASPGSAARYAMLMLVPPQVEALQTAAAPRDLTLVIDTSGSMHGDSIAQARQAVQVALDGLRPADRFNLIRFSDHTTALFGDLRPASAAALDLARRWVNGLRADGGTEMAGALELALPAAPEAARRLSQVVFVTDGAVGNEDELFDIIRRRLGRHRLFTVGIGSAPNAHFMRQAAGLGRGSFTFIGSPGEVAERMAALLRQLARPPLGDVGLELLAEDGTPLPVQGLFPSPIPDLYPGEPLLVALELAPGATRIRVRGRFGERPWQAELDARGARPAAGVARLWARRRIEHLLERRAAGDGGESEALRGQVLQTALAHHLVSPFTALVAVDTTPLRPPGVDGVTRALPTLLPQGWSHAHVFGVARTASPAALHLLAGALLLGLALLAARRRPA